MIKLPIYIICHFQNAEHVQVDYNYKIDSSDVQVHPYQLYKRDVDHAWINLSIYASIEDAIMVLLKELFSIELADQINHGQATINTSEIMEKINRGDRSVFVYDSMYNSACQLNIDVNFEDLVERKQNLEANADNASSKSGLE